MKIEELCRVIDIIQVSESIYTLVWLIQKPLKYTCGIEREYAYSELYLN